MLLCFATSRDMYNIYTHSILVYKKSAELNCIDIKKEERHKIFPLELILFVKS